MRMNTGNLSLPIPEPPDGGSLAVGPQSRPPIHRSSLWLLAVLILPIFTRTTAFADDTVLKQTAARKWQALIVASTPVKGGPMATMSCGCFVDPSGLAVFDLSAFSGTRPAEEFYLMDHTKLHNPVLYHVSADPAIAIVKFDHKPQAWIEPDSRQVELGLEVALIDPLDASPVATGPIVALPMTSSANLREPCYQPSLSIGAGMSAKRAQPPMTGAPVVDAGGKLRGMFSGIRPLGTQTLIYASPVDQLPKAMEKARQSGKPIALPLPPELVPYDPATNHPDYTQAIAAFSAHQFAAARLHVRKALADFPKSFLLRGLEFDIAMQAKDGDLLKLAEALKPETDNPVLKTSYFHSLARAHRLDGEYEAAGRAYEQAIGTSPKDEVTPRWEYSQLLESQDKLEKALSLRREAVECNPENIAMLYSLQNLLERLRKTQEADQISERIYHLEELYRRK